MNRLDSTFRDLARREKKALIAYLAAGYPRFEEQRRIIRAMIQEGVDILELGVPFSDPIADGPTIQFASMEALKHGTTLRGILVWTAQLRKEFSIPIVFMTYLNPVLRYGLEKLAKDAAKAGVDGVIVPDLIPEEADEIRRTLRKHGIQLIHLVAPTTPRDRQRRIAQLTGGFLYAVSVTGVTGARAVHPPETKTWLKSLSALTNRPVCVGFGISGADQVRNLRASVDGFIVGSALIDVIRKSSSGRRETAVRKFVRQLSKECGHGN